MMSGGRHEVTEILPPDRWALPAFREAWAHRELLFMLAWRDVSVRYKQTVLGAAWALIQPLTTMILFTLIFGRFAKGYGASIIVAEAIKYCTEVK